jgi:hypothetical protein
VLVAALGAVIALTLSVAQPVPPPPPPPPPPHPEDGAERVLDELLPALDVAPGVAHRELTTTAAAGGVMGDVVEADLADPTVRIDLMTPGAVAGRASVAHMANRTGAVAGINGDFFDIGRTDAPVGPAVAGGRPLKAAVPHHRRMGPAVPGAEVDSVFAVDRNGVGRIDRLRLDASARTRSRTVPIVALNQYAVPVDGIGIFTPDWGEVDRSKTLCGSDTDRNAPCAPEQAEAVVHDGVVTITGRPIGGRIAAGDITLTGRDRGAAAVRELRVGDRVEVVYALVPDSGHEPYFAVGCSPILRDGVLVPGLDDRERAPRSAVGVDSGGRHLWLVTVDGRQSDSVGATVRELASLLREMGVDDAVNLDGGGSSTLVYRAPGAPDVTIVNDPSDPSPRLVSNGIGVYAR